MRLTKRLVDLEKYLVRHGTPLPPTKNDDERLSMLQALFDTLNGDGEAMVKFYLENEKSNNHLRQKTYRGRKSLVTLLRGMGLHE